MSRLMERVIRIYLALMLSTLLVLTGQGLALSRGISAPVGQMVICTGTGPVTIYMDEDGQPTRPPHYCPDYALMLLGAVIDAEPELSTPAPAMRAGSPAAAVALAQPAIGAAQARAPPLAV